MKILITILIITFFIVSCSPSDEAIQRAISQTQTALPSPTQTPTKIPFSKIPLSDIVFQEGDLPPGYSPAQIRSSLGDLSDDIPAPDNFISYSMSKNGSNGGLVDILIYENNENIDNYLKSVSANMPGDGNSADVGEKGNYRVNILFVNAVSVSFYRCHSLVTMQFQGTISKDDVISYAKRLDERLKNLFCE